MSDELLSATEIHERYGIDRRTLSRWENASAVAPVRTLTGHRRYRRAEVERAIAQGVTEDVAEPAPEPEPPAPKSARRLALEALHAADIAGTDPNDELDALGVVDEDARALVRGVSSERAQLDDIIRASAENWSLERMPVVDRNLLRIATYELVHARATAAAAISEAVALARLLSTEDSGRFINGVLGRIAREHRGAH